MERAAKMLAVALIVLALVGTAGFIAAGCGGSDEKQAKNDLSGAITGLETSFANLKTAGATMTVGDLKKTQPLAAAVDQVVQAGKNVSGAETSAFETAFAALRDAVFAFPDDTNLMTALTQVMPKALAVLQAGEALKALTAPE